MEKQYVIGVTIYYSTEPKNNNIEETFLAYENGAYYTVNSISMACFYNTNEKAMKVIKEIITEKPCKMFGGEIYPPIQIHRIGNMSNTRKSIKFSFKIIELDFTKYISIYSGSVSFKHPKIKISF